MWKKLSKGFSFKKAYVVSIFLETKTQNTNRTETAANLDIYAGKSLILTSQLQEVFLYR